MLCKYYRRRYKFQLVIVVIIVTFLYFDLFKTVDNSDSILEIQKKREINNNIDENLKINEKGARINSKNYVPPTSW